MSEDPRDDPGHITYDRFNKPQPLREAQVMELQTRWTKYHETTDRIKAATIVEYKKGLSYPRLVGHAIMLWRYLNDLEHDFVDNELIKDAISGRFFNRVDCIIAIVREGELVFLPEDSFRLQPVKPEE